MKRDHTEMLAVLRKASMLQVAGSALSFAVEFVLMLGYTFLLQSRIPPFPYLGLINGIVGISTISYCFTLIQGAWAIDQTVDQFGKMDAADAGAGLEEISWKAQTAREGIVQGFKFRLLAHTVFVAIEFVFAHTVYTAAVYLVYLLLYQMGKAVQNRFQRKLQELLA